ncbi:unnamed protein product [Paramecium pentaurelia]|uniref:TLDc domain-containing protein n=1 Tax=Paramecium pentaurelia TaxID=43138 RepID=A0A8S1XVT4_9CILI|nr:unnamed protein product [Paramecium pentaurelia]
MQVQCPKHKDSQFLYILPKENEVEFICDQCHSNLSTRQQQVQLQNLINIRKAYQHPEYLFSRITNSEILQEFFIELIECEEKNLNYQIMEIEKFIKEVQNQLIVMQQELYVYKKKYMELRLQIREKLEEIIKFDQFKKIISNLNHLEKTINPQDIKQSERDVYNYFQDSILKKQLSLNNQIFTILNYKNQQTRESRINYPEWNKLNQLYKQINEMHTSFNIMINPKFPGTIENTFLLAREFQAKLIDIIVKKSNKPITKIELIHQECQSNLNVQTFWNKVDGKDNLLMVFQSEKEYIFGAYSPCQWVKSQRGQYVSDETLTSFLFSQTKNQIYPIKQDCRGYAIYCCFQNGPVFGGTSLLNRAIQYFQNKSDLHITSNFQNGSSSLGTSYAIEGNQTQTDFEINLFGLDAHKITTYEIFQLSFN